MFSFIQSAQRGGNFKKPWAALVFLIAGLMLSGAGFSLAADEKAPPTDWSTPKAAAKTFAYAMEHGDAEVVRTSCLADAKQGKLLDALVGSLKGMKSLREAVTTKFGAEALKTFHLDGGEEKISDEVDNAEVKEEADTATLTAKNKPDEKPLTLKKVDGKWKVDLSFMSAQMQDMDKTLMMINASASVMQSVAADIQSGKLSTAKQAEDEFGSRMMAAFVGSANTTEPTTAPTDPGMPK